MPQATDTRTMSRDRVSSVAAFSPKITSPLRPAPSALKLAHTTMITALLGEHAEEITGAWAHPFEITDRAEHIERLLKPVIDYVDVVLGDTADYAFMHRAVVVGQLRDAAADLAAHVRFRAELAAEEKAGV